MSLLDTEIPDIDRAPGGATRSAIGAHLRAEAKRRTVLKLAAGAGMTLGLSAVGVLAGAKKASAGWNSTYDTWSNCSPNDYFNSSTTCTPPSWDISSFNCNGANYHRDDGASGTCYSQHWYVQFTSCDGKNAWIWSSPHTRCSDGYYYYSVCGGSGMSYSICKYVY